MEETKTGRFRQVLTRTMTIARDAWAIIGLTMILLLILEFAYRGQAEVRRSFRERAQSSDEVVRPFDEEWVPDYMAELTPSKALAWKPFVYYRRRPFSGAYINVDSLGHRITPQEPSPGASRQIWFFGGSTMFGWKARDHKTIPAIMVDSLVARGLEGIEVTNFGETGYVFTQEVIELILQLRDGQRPDVVVFYDGINDVYASVQSGVPGVPQNETNRSSEFELGRTFSLENATLGNDLLAARALLGLTLQRVQLFNRLIVAVSQPWSSDLSADHSARVASSYLSAAELVEVLGKHYGFVPIFFWQPSVRATRKPLSEFEQGLIRSIDSDPYFAAAEDVLTTLRSTINAHAASRSIEGFRDISGVFDNRTETVFVDQGGHTTEAANELIVAGMIESVIEALEATETGSPGT